jgi:hypothetical protein
VDSIAGYVYFIPYCPNTDNFNKYKLGSLYERNSYNYPPDGSNLPLGTFCSSAGQTFSINDQIDITSSANTKCAKMNLGIDTTTSPGTTYFTANYPYPNS